MKNKPHIKIITINDIRIQVHLSDLMSQLRGHVVGRKSLLVRCPLDTSDNCVIEYVKATFPKMISQSEPPSVPIVHKDKQRTNDHFDVKAYYEERDYLYNRISQLFKSGCKKKRLQYLIRELKKNVSFKKNIAYIETIAKRFAGYEEERQRRVSQRLSEQEQRERSRIDPEIRALFKEVANPNGQAFDKTAYIKKYNTKLIYIAKK